MSPKRWLPLLLGIGVASAWVRTEDLRPTLGKLEKAEAICGPQEPSPCAGLDRGTRSPKMRAQRAKPPGDEATLDFVYLGPTAEMAPLASGEERRQLGLKLRAQDSCNVLYVMWRLEPRAGLVVNRKANPGLHRHAECGTKGYRILRPERRGPVPPLRIGERHRMRARVDHQRLRVWIDEDLVWEGTLDEGAARLSGPIGVRSDNVRFAFRLRG